MTHLNMLTFMMYHNNTLVYTISALRGSEEEIEVMARAMCELRGGIVNVYANNDIDLDWWEFTYINSGNRIWKVSQDDLFEWQDKCEMSDDDIFFYYMYPQQPKSRLDVGKWLIMGEHVREFTPRAKRHHRRALNRKVRRSAHELIREQLS